MNYEDMGKKEKKENIGSPPKLTKELIKQICLCLKNGAYIEIAVIACGISKSTYYNWRKKALEPNAPALYKHFLDSTEMAQALSEMRDLDIIDKAAESGQWKASAWRLERKNPERWGARQFIEQNVSSHSVVLSESELDNQLHILQQVLDNTKKDKDCSCDE